MWRPHQSLGSKSLKLSPIHIPHETGQAFQSTFKVYPGSTSSYHFPHPTHRHLFLAPRLKPLCPTLNLTTSGPLKVWSHKFKPLVLTQSEAPWSNPALLSFKMHLQPHPSSFPALQSFWASVLLAYGSNIFLSLFCTLALSTITVLLMPTWASLEAQMVKNRLQCGRPWFDPLVGKISWRRERLFTAAFLPGEFHGQRSLAGYSPWGHKESDTTERLSLYFIS